MKSEDLFQLYLDRAKILRNSNDYDEARNVLKLARDLCKSDDSFELAIVFTRMGQIERDVGNTKKARQFYGNALLLFIQSGTKDKEAHTRRHLGEIDSELGLIESSEQQIEQALELYISRADTDEADMANLLRAFAVLMEKFSKIERAKKMWTIAKDLYDKAGIKDGYNECKRSLLRLTYGAISDN